MKKNFAVFLLVFIILTSFILFFYFAKEKRKEIETEIEVFSISPHQILESPVVVEGKAKGNWFFEASFPVEILGEEGEVLGSSYVEAQEDWMKEGFVSFKGRINFVSPKEQKGFLVLKSSNPSGMKEFQKEYKIPVILQKSKFLKIKVFFNNDKRDPEFSCYKVFGVEREIPYTLEVAKAAIEELLKGPTEEEKLEGFLTSINSGVSLQKIAIRDGIAYVDFDEKLEEQVGGSCRVSAIRNQIIETLKQFPTVKDVIISINGRTEDILQP